MSPKHFDKLTLLFHDEYLEMIFHDTAHFNDDTFLNCMALKQEHFGDKPTGVWITREDPNARHSIDPMFLINHKELLETHISWVTIVSDVQSDFQNMQYILQLTAIPCKFVPTPVAAKVWIESL